MEHDLIDQMNELWQRERPDLDSSPLELVGRVIVIAQYLEKSVNEALSIHGLTLGQFDILATLRRQGRQGRLTPTQLIENVMLSSGGMTNRLDRLEEAGWIQRQPDPQDRRGVVIALTRDGCKLIDGAATTRFQEAGRSMLAASGQQKDVVIDYLRRWLLSLTATKSMKDDG
jgi:DNA-binding MarR family transcriptional regulator